MTVEFVLRSQARRLHGYSLDSTVGYDVLDDVLRIMKVVLAMAVFGPRLLERVQLMPLGRGD